MNTMEVLNCRRSIRTYTGEGISRAELMQILDAAYAAPVGMGAYDTMALTVVTNPHLLAQYDDAAAKLFKNREHPLYGAPIMIVVSAQMQEAPLDNVSYSNAAIIAHNMTLAAVEMGIGSCLIWGAVIAGNNDPELVAKLNLPEGYKPCCSVVLGRTNEEYQPREIPENRIKTLIIE
ncbi:MAG: nitroreductase family protein [Firmicutes bacterium]|nr:nitroreductase family protein [Bacillota bacterium]MBQ4093314.1 nitroreductase family protein [Bacillota bacterium]